MTSVHITDQVLARTFITALLLTESPERAEAAVLEGVRAMERSEISGEALLQGTLAASIAARIRGRRVEKQADALCLLPLELRRVLRLPPDRRRCFVLRVLVGLSREDCARMLQTEVHQIDELVYLSVRALARAAAIFRH